MKEVSVEELFDNYNFFVPEIQREYVWGHNYREILDIFFNDLKEAKSNSSATSQNQQKISELAQKGEYDKIKELLGQMEDSHPMNIGFLYSYEPNYRMDIFPDSEIYHDVYLIDGQQRLTTLFLMLFYLSIKENKKDEFIQMFRFNKELETIAFDYRVRNLTHRFIIDSISNISTLDDFKEVDLKTWYLQEYANDPTVQAVLKAFRKIDFHFRNEETGFFEFLKDKVKFWHFKTEKTDQGEELYITMNSRGKQLEENETVRAKFFESIDDEKELLKWSAKWEEWQDFFWIHRDKSNSLNSADQGFNEFLKSIAGLQSLKLESGEYLEVSDNIPSSKLLKFLSLDIINDYFEALQYLYLKKDEFIAYFEYSEWIESCFDFINEILFRSETNWFINPQDDLRARERRRMVFFWSILEYLQFKKQNQDDWDLLEVFRLVRVYWLRYNNYDRKVNNIIERITYAAEFGVWNQNDTNDEEKRHNFLQNLNSETIFKFESSIWKIEDHPLNLNGYQVQNINITHLVDFDSKLTLKSLEKVNDKFRSLFGSSSTPSSDLNTILLFYGWYANKVSPYYYSNWDFRNWRRIVRDFDSKKKVFKSFFDEYNKEDLTEILKQKQDEFLEIHSDEIANCKDLAPFTELIDILRVYSILIPKMWKHGRFIADYEPTVIDRLCEGEKTVLYNTKGNFRGYGNGQLWYMCKDANDDNPIGKLKEKVNELV
ncbi:DUF262 domain-containing protein [Christiangramia sp.]|uniref:DUF262 domain-containing protein n=1 Tax=Christiangramia sp. TaxID=1931228 RepID=UPI0026294B67|nr:DUF262 domain-containing protein [Christiangramia sp.]